MSTPPQARLRARNPRHAWDARVASAALVVSVGVGYAASRQPVAGIAFVGLLATAIGTLAVGRTFVVGAAVAALPWMVVFSDVLPADLKTFTSAGATIAVCAYVLPLRPRNRLVLWGVGFFLAAILYGTVLAVSGAQLIQAAKYMVFPFMALAVTSVRARTRLPRILRPVLVSSGCAMAVHIAVIAAGLGTIGSYYGIGERLGFDAAGPHELALMGVIVACGGLAAFERVAVRMTFLALGLIPALETGVRSAVVAAALVIVIFLVNSRLKMRHVFVVAGVGAVLVAGGVVGVAETRISTDIRTGEFSSLATAGSGRGAIWTVALKHYAASGPDGIVLGTGLRSIGAFELQDLGSTFVGHSDLIEVGVQLGLLGFAGWLMIWAVLLGDALLSRIVLVPIVVYAVLNGVIESTAPLAVGLFLAAAAPRLRIEDLLPSRPPDAPTLRAASAR